VRRTVRLVAAAAVGVVLLPGSATAAVTDPVVASVASAYPLNCNGAGCRRFLRRRLHRAGRAR
jgi:hypothetical protein